MMVTLVGPTATGKSDLALEVAEKIKTDTELSTVFPGGTEIISADAFQLYRGMNIGTAKLPPEQRRGVPHHQIDKLWPDEEASVAQYQKHARADTLSIQKRQALPLIVGGSGLYIRALIDQLNFPPTNPQVRAHWQNQLEILGSTALHKILQHKDPAAAATINPQNARRIVRALESIELTGKPFSANLPNGKYWQKETLQFYVTRPPSQLETRINIRAQQMFNNGLIEETKALLNDTAHPLGLTAAKATGYTQAKEFIQGNLTLEAAIESTALATRQLAKKQHKWFKRDPRLKPINTFLKQNETNPKNNTEEKTLNTLAAQNILTEIKDTLRL